MKNSTSTTNFKDISIFSAVAVLTIVAFICTYYFKLSAPIQAIIWIVWFFLGGALIYFTVLGQQIVTFFNEAKIELLKVVWPTRQETIQTTTIVMAMVAVTGFVLWGVDTLMIWIVAKITHLG